MNTHRKLIASFCIASLLYGNVAGLMHLGCVETAAESDVSHGCDPAAVPHGTCSHHHATRGERATSPKPPTARANNNHPVHKSEHAPHQHHPDACGICKNFFTTRNAVPLTVAATLCGTEEMMEFCGNLSAAILTQKPCMSTSVRGPPQV